MTNKRTKAKRAQTEAPRSNGHVREVPRENRPRFVGNLSKHVRYNQFGAFIDGQTTENLDSPSQGYGSAQSLRNSGRGIQAHIAEWQHAFLDANVIRPESQRLYRDNGIYQAIVHRLSDVIFGDGWALQARTSNPDQNKAIEALWSTFWDSAPEAREMDDGGELESLFFSHLVVDGDFGILKLKDGHIQFLDADRICNLRLQRNSKTGNRIDQGVELDKLGKPIGFYIADYTASGTIDNKPKYYPAEKIIYQTYRRRIEQTRGEPAMQAIFPMLHRFTDVCDSEVAAWQLLSRLAVAILRKDGPGIAAAMGELKSADGDTEEKADPVKRFMEFTDAAIVFHGEQGDDIRGIERNIPGANFVESAKMFLRLIGMPLGLTLEFMLLIWSDTNYSSGRASSKQVERSCRRWINKIRKVLTQIYVWQVQRWISQGVVKNSPDVFAHDWRRQPYPFIDPQKEAQAQTERLQSGLSSPSLEGIEDGTDDEELVRMQTRDIERRHNAAEEANKANPGLNLTWRDFTAFGRGTKQAPQSNTQGTPTNADAAKNGSADDKGGGADNTQT